jgi:FimV-like protein
VAPAKPAPKPIDELLKDIDFNLGDERSRAVIEGKEPSPLRGGSSPRMPDAEPPTASVTRTPGPLATPALAKSAESAKPTPPLEPLSELPTGLELDKIDFDLGDLGLATRKPVAELPPMELKPKAAAAPEPLTDLGGMDFNLPDLEPLPGPAPAAEEPAKPKPSDFKFEFADVSQEQRREDLAPLDFDDSTLNLGKMDLSPPLGGGEEAGGADYVETKLDLAAAYLDMGDQVGARSLLEDVIKEGDAGQKQRAEALLKKLG